MYYVNRGAAYQKIDLLDNAYKDFSKALELNPDNRDALYGMGKTLYSMGKVHEAFPYFKKIGKSLYLVGVL